MPRPAPTGVPVLDGLRLAPRLGLRLTGLLLCRLAHGLPHHGIVLCALCCCALRNLCQPPPAEGETQRTRRLLWLAGKRAGWPGVALRCGKLLFLFVISRGMALYLA